VERRFPFKKKKKGMLGGVKRTKNPAEPLWERHRVHAPLLLTWERVHAQLCTGGEMSLREKKGRCPLKGAASGGAQRVDLGKRRALIGVIRVGGKRTPSSRGRGHGGWREKPSQLNGSGTECPVGENLLHDRRRYEGESFARQEEEPDWRWETEGNKDQKKTRAENHPPRKKKGRGRSEAVSLSSARS